MRQIKFRAWDKKDKKYLYSDKQEFICTTHSNGLGVTIPFDIDEKYGPDVDGIDWADADLLMGRYELEQFTGLYDKNGKEIYENDILEFEGKTLVVIWVEDWCQFTMQRVEDYKSNAEDWCHYDLFKSLSDKYEVIGNIHENKELLGYE